MRQRLFAERQHLVQLLGPQVARDKVVHRRERVRVVAAERVRGLVSTSNNGTAWSICPDSSRATASLLASASVSGWSGPERARRPQVIAGTASSPCPALQLPGRFPPKRAAHPGPHDGVHRHSDSPARTSPRRVVSKLALQVLRRAGFKPRIPTPGGWRPPRPAGAGPLRRCEQSSRPERPPARAAQRNVPESPASD